MRQSRQFLVIFLALQATLINVSTVVINVYLLNQYILFSPKAQQPLPPTPTQIWLSSTPPLIFTPISTERPPTETVAPSHTPTSLIPATIGPTPTQFHIPTHTPAP